MTISRSPAHLFQERQPMNPSASRSDYRLGSLLSMARVTATPVLSARPIKRSPDSCPWQWVPRSDGSLDMHRRDDVAVEIRGDRDRRVAEPLADDLWTRAFHEHECGVSVPEDVEPDMGQARSPNGPAPLPGQDVQ